LAYLRDQTVYTRGTRRAWGSKRWVPNTATCRQTSPSLKQPGYLSGLGPGTVGSHTLKPSLRRQQRPNHAPSSAPPNARPPSNAGPKPWGWTDVFPPPFPPTRSAVPKTGPIWLGLHRGQRPANFTSCALTSQPARLERWTPTNRRLRPPDPPNPSAPPTASNNHTPSYAHVTRGYREARHGNDLGDSRHKYFT